MTELSPRAWGLPRPMSPPSAHGSGYPHVHRAYHRPRACYMCHIELSPRAWGVPRNQPPLSAFPRVIPTCVGLTHVHPTAVAARPSYPHVRGAYLRRTAFLSRKAELSPRAWGVRDRILCTRYHARVIPTCVGRTPSTSRTPDGLRSYPHVRGAYVKKSHWLDVGIELSPRTWGLPLSTCGDVGGWRVFDPTFHC